MERKIGIGIIGFGRIGRLHADNALVSDKVVLKGVSDLFIDQIKGTKYEQAVNLVTDDPYEIINHDEIDAVFICANTDSHVDLITACASAGKHVFCEKPISFNLEETKKALEAVNQSGVKFQVGFNRRFDKHFRKVQETVRKGDIGDPHIIKITSRDPETPPEAYIKRSGGMFMDMTIHDFDMIRYLSGKEVVEVSVKAANLIDPKFGRNDDVDTAIITLTFEDGSLGVIDNSREAAYGYDQRIEVFGSKGVVSANNEQPTNVEISTKESVTVDHPKYFFLERYHDAYVDEMEEFAKAILDDEPLLLTGEDGAKAEQLAKAAKLSRDQNRPVSISELNVTI
ncbi:inositol 2-dehydrogenase [Lentibacillus salinarum]|uniref:Inositol 2-dehydrogenase n=1 Tax=Lentibacillus salinarum TaxID=446820 RepID=A0ABW3ZX83_9BACI